MPVNVRPGELLHLLLPYLVQNLSKTGLSISLQNMKQIVSNGEMLVYPGSLSDRNISVLLSIHLVTQGSVQLINAPATSYMVYVIFN